MLRHLVRTENRCRRALQQDRLKTREKDQEKGASQLASLSRRSEAAYFRNGLELEPHPSATHLGLKGVVEAQDRYIVGQYLAEVG